MDILFSDEFRKEYRKIKDKETRTRVIKQLQKLAENPEAGKPLHYELKLHRSVRVTPYRIIYRIEKETMVIICFDHRKDVYEK